MNFTPSLVHRTVLVAVQGITRSRPVPEISQMIITATTVTVAHLLPRRLRPYKSRHNEIMHIGVPTLAWTAKTNHPIAVFEC